MKRSPYMGGEGASSIRRRPAIVFFAASRRHADPRRGSRGQRLGLDEQGGAARRDDGFERQHARSVVAGTVRALRLRPPRRPAACPDDIASRTSGAARHHPAPVAFTPDQHLDLGGNDTRLRRGPSEEHARQVVRGTPLPRILKTEIGDVQLLGDPSHQNSGGQRVTLNLRSRLIRQIGQLLDEAVRDELDVH